MLLLWLAASFLLGIVAASWLALPLAGWALLTFLPLSYFPLWARDPIARRGLAALFFFFLGAVRLTWADQPPDPGALARFNDRGRVTLSGLVVAAPDDRGTLINLRVSVTEIAIGLTITRTHGLALVQLPPGRPVLYGDQVRVEGTLTRPPAFPGFDYHEYLARQDVLSLVRNARVTVTAHDQGEPLLAALIAFRERAHLTIERILPEPAASVLSGLLLNLDRGIPGDLRADFDLTGATHILAIDGFKLAVVAALLARLISFLPPRRAAPFVILGIVLYTLLVGAGPSAVRAAIMAGMGLTALLLGRRSWALTSLAFAVLVMLALNPRVLWDLGFQLSAVSTLGILLLVPPLEQALHALIQRCFTGARARAAARVVAESAAVTLAAQVVSTPLIVLAFHRLSLAGVLTNLLIMPLQPPLVLAGALAAFAGMLLLPLGQLLSLVPWALLQLTIWIVQFTARLPLASLDTGAAGLSFALAYYLLLLLTTQGRRLWPHLTTVRSHQALASTRDIFTRPTLPALLGGSALIALAAGFALLPDARAHVEFLALDAGRAALVRTPGGSRILIDAGEAPSAVAAALAARMPLWEHGLDLLVLTTNDDAHLAGASAMLERFDVGLIVEPDPPARRTPAYIEWLALEKRRGVQVRPAHAGLALELDGVRLDLLYPPQGENGATVLRLTVGPERFLFCGGLDKAGVAALQKGGDDLAAEVLLPPREVDTALLERVGPALAILFTGRPGGLARARELPSAAALTALAGLPTYQTGEVGTVEFIVDGDDIQLLTK